MTILEEVRKAKNEQNSVHFDWTINIGTIGSIFLLIFTLARYANEVVGHLKSVDNKVTIMWIDFAKKNPEAARQLQLLEGKISSEDYGNSTGR